MLPREVSMTTSVRPMASRLSSEQELARNATRARARERICFFISESGKVGNYNRNFNKKKAARMYMPMVTFL